MGRVCRPKHRVGDERVEPGPAAAGSCCPIRNVRPRTNFGTKVFQSCISHRLVKDFELATFWGQQRVKSRTRSKPPRCLLHSVAAPDSLVPSRVINDDYWGYHKSGFTIFPKVAKRRSLAPRLVSDLPRSWCRPDGDPLAPHRVAALLKSEEQTQSSSGLAAGPQKGPGSDDTPGQGEPAGQVCVSALQIRGWSPATPQEENV
jgi:hypothetical protein